MSQSINSQVPEANFQKGNFQKGKLPNAIFQKGNLYSTNFPPPPADCGILLFALPRASAEHSALNRFLDKTASLDKTRIIELFFIYKGSGRAGDLDEAAELCASHYRRRQGLRVRLIRGEV